MANYLRDEEVLSVLMAQGWDETEAIQAARMSGGLMSRALDYRARNTAKGPVIACLRAVATRDPELLRSALIRFDDNNLTMLRQWLVEVRSQRWREFTPADRFNLSTAVLDRLERAVRGGASIRLAIHWALDPLIGDD